MDKPEKVGKPIPVRRPEGEESPPRPAPGVEPTASPPPAAEEDRRPTPVRMAMEGADAEGSSEGPPQRTFSDPEGGEDWVVTIGGRSASGILPLRTVALLDLNFARVGEPQNPLRRVLCPGGDLDELSEETLLAAFLDSEPFRPSLREEKEEKRNRRGRGPLNPGG
jgi:hypothetical protein